MNQYITCKLQKHQKQNYTNHLPIYHENIFTRLIIGPEDREKYISPLFYSHILSQIRLWQSQILIANVKQGPCSNSICLITIGTWQQLNSQTRVPENLFKKDNTSLIHLYIHVDHFPSCFPQNLRLRRKMRRLTLTLARLNIFMTATPSYWSCKRSCSSRQHKIILKCCLIKDNN